MRIWLGYGEWIAAGERERIHRCACLISHRHRQAQTLGDRNTSEPRRGDIAGANTADDCRHVRAINPEHVELEWVGGVCQAEILSHSLAMEGGDDVAALSGQI